MVFAYKGNTIGRLQAETYPSGRKTKPPPGAKNQPEGLCSLAVRPGLSPVL